MYRIMNPRKHHTNQIVMRIGRWSNEELRPGVNLLGGEGDTWHTMLRYVVHEVGLLK
jgi:hypothetical protein